MAGAPAGLIVAESLAAAVGHAWRAPREAMANQVARGLSEPRAVFHLLTACGLYAVASLPAAVREAAQLDVEDPLSAAIAAHLFGYLGVAPLVAYGAAALIHLAARGFGATGPFLAARAALFWALLLGTPIALALALLGVAAEASGTAGLLLSIQLLGYAGLGYWLWLFAASLAEAEGFAGTGRVAAVVAATFVGVAAVLAALAGGSATAG